MSQESFWYWLFLIVVPLLGLWYCVSNIRASTMSGYAFYRIAAFLQGVPFFLAAILFVFRPKAGIALFFLPYIVNGLGKTWISLQEKKANQKDPARWAAWQAKRAGLSKWNKLFL